MKIRYYGHVGQLSGYGRAAADNCLALIAAGADLEIRPLIPKGQQGVRVPNDELRKRCRADDTLSPCDVAIVHDLPVDAARVAGILREMGVACPLVCFTTWEATSTSQAVTQPLRERFDEVWVPSLANHAAFSGIMFSPNQESNRRVRVLPHSFDPERAGIGEGFARREGRFRFYYVGAWNSRKNVAGLVRAWAYAFKPDDPVELVLQCAGTSPQVIAAAVGMTGLVPDEMAPIRPSIVHLNDGELGELHRTADCFVTASRGEAWNYPCFDAVLAGRMVIAPRGLGSDDYLAGTSADMVSCAAQPAAVDVNLSRTDNGGFSFERVGAQGLASRDSWREPDLGELASSMRGVARVHERDLKIRYDLVERYGHKAVGQKALGYLTELLNRCPQQT